MVRVLGENWGDLSFTQPLGEPELVISSQSTTQSCYEGKWGRQLFASF